MDIGLMIFDCLSKLIFQIIDDEIKASIISFVEKIRVRQRVETSTAEIVNSLVPFLLQENISEEKIERLIKTCVIELTPFTKDPTPLFKGSLDGQKIFETLYNKKPLPQEIVEDDLQDTYSLLFPRIATLICKLPAAVKDWENEAWSENFRRFDEFTTQMKLLFIKVDEIGSVQQKNSDATLIQFKRMLAQKVGFQLDLTGLRSDQPFAGNFSDFFVLPELARNSQNQVVDSDSLKREELRKITSSEKCMSFFTSLGKKCVIYGAPGSGKSTWTKWLQKETLTINSNIVGIRVEFQNLHSPDLPTIYELIRQSVSYHMREELTAEKIGSWLENNNVVFIFDGFDEVKPNERQDIITWVKGIESYASKCPIIITSRLITTNHLETLSTDWESWRIEPFNLEKIILYIEKWYSFSPLLTDSQRSIDATFLGNSWSNDPIIGPLTDNPLLLSTLLLVHHLDGKLPNGRSNLYKRYVEGMLGVWDARNKRTATNIEVSVMERQKIIKGIALYFFAIDKETIEEELLITWLESFLPKIDVHYSPNEILLILRERTGLLIGPGEYSFAHKTIKEFLVAEAVFDGDQTDINGNTINAFYLFGKRKDDRWNTVIFLWAGIAAIYEIKNFILECIEDHPSSLGLGLFFDQYHRFMIDDRKEIFSKIITQKKLVSSEKIGWIDYGGPFNNENFKFSIEMPRINLRGLTFFPGEFSSLVSYGVKDECLTWEMVKGCQGSLYSIFWGVFITSNLSSDKWNEILQSPFPRSLPHEKCKQLIARWRIARINRNANDILFDCRNFSRVFPEYEGYVVLALMNEITEELMGLFSEDKEDNVLHSIFEIDWLSKIIEYIINVPVKKIFVFKDQYTDWEIQSSESINDLARGNLLSLFQNTINNLPKNLQIQLGSDIINKLRSNISSLLSLSEELTTTNQQPK